MLGSVRGRFHMLRLAEAPPHPDLLHSPSQTGVNALMARGEKETALRPGYAGAHFSCASSAWAAAGARTLAPEIM